MDSEYERLKALAESEIAKDQKVISAARLKLINRLLHRTIPVSFDDGQGGEIVILIRAPTLKMRRRLYQIDVEVGEAVKGNDIETLERIEDEVAQILEDLCVESSYDAEFWKAGEGMDVEVPAKILLVAKGMDPRLAEAAYFFRNQ